MIKKLLFLSLLVLGLAQPALAKPTSDNFCNLSPNDMLASLDGTWSLKQGPTSIVGMAMAFPGVPAGLMLPARGPQQFKLKYLEDLGYSQLSAQGQSMAMISTPDDNVAVLSDYLDQEKKAGVFAPGPGCDWSSLPMMVGSKIYPLKGKTPGSKTLGMMYIPLPSGNGVVACIGTNGATGASPFGFPDCNRPPKAYDAKGSMTMTLIVKFQSANSASGVVLFRGGTFRGKYKNKQSTEFFATAPVTLSR